MHQNTKARKKTFAIRNVADYKARVVSNTFEGLELNIDQNLISAQRVLGLSLGNKISNIEDQSPQLYFWSNRASPNPCFCLF